MSQVAVLGILRGNRQALPVREAVGERPARGSQFLDPLTQFVELLSCGEDEFVVLGLGGALRLGRPQRREPLVGVAAA